jgi:hypothetical protein
MSNLVPLRSLVNCKHPRIRFTSLRNFGCDNLHCSICVPRRRRLCRLLLVASRATSCQALPHPTSSSSPPSLITLCSKHRAEPRGQPRTPEPSARNFLTESPTRAQCWTSAKTCCSKTLRQTGISAKQEHCRIFLNPRRCKILLMAS